MKTYVLITDGNTIPVSLLPLAQLTPQQCREANRKLDMEGIAGDWVSVEDALRQSSIDRWVEVRKCS